jgi:hypothetical protein
MPRRTGGRDVSEMVPAPLSRRRLLAAGLSTGAALALGTRAARAGLVMEDGSDEPDAPEGPQTPGAEATPSFSDVAQAGPDEVLRFLAGRHPRYPGANIESLMAFSPADILETMDTDVMDSVQAARGFAAVQTLYALIAREILEALLAVYGGAPVVLALDAGHGGLRGVYYDPGSNGTEAVHARHVVAALEARAADPRYASITIHRIFNDAIGDDFGLPPPEDRKSAAALTIRNARAAMLAQEAAVWNAAHPDAPVQVHVLSVHFNAGSGGILVLHEGSSVPEPFRSLSVAYARAYVNSARPALISTGLLPYVLRLALGTGLSDDHLLYEPPVRVARINPYTGADRSAFPRRYAMLQTSLLERDYALGALIYNGLV